LILSNLHHEIFSSVEARGRRGMRHAQIQTRSLREVVLLAA
jgi:hypothetical protein